MNRNIAIGVDVGGSHITSAAVDLRTLSIMPGTMCSNRVDNKADLKDVFEDWSKAINQTIASVPQLEELCIGFAMPGPFHYKTGLAMFTGNDKYESLYNISIPAEFTAFIKGVHTPELRFLNDATAFGVGVATTKELKDRSKIITLTLGTGFGSAFIEDGVPKVKSEQVPKGGYLWDEPFKKGIGDDYFSTRWFVKRYNELSSKEVCEVKAIAEAGDDSATIVFQEFAMNMVEFMIPFLEKFHPQTIVLGGNISKAHKLFLPALKASVQKSGLNIEFKISNLTEGAAILGSAKLFRPEFWNQVKEDLPNL